MQPQLFELLGMLLLGMAIGHVLRNVINLFRSAEHERTIDDTLSIIAYAVLAYVCFTVK